MKETLINLFTPALTAIITVLISWGLSILQKKVKSDEGKNAIDQINNIIDTVVTSLMQVDVSSLKKDAGILNAGQKNLIKVKAIKSVNNLLTDGLKSTASGILGNLNSYIDNRIEKLVYDSKKEASSAVKKTTGRSKANK